MLFALAGELTVFYMIYIVYIHIDGDKHSKLSFSIICIITWHDYPTILQANAFLTVFFVIYIVYIIIDPQLSKIKSLNSL